MPNQLDDSERVPAQRSYRTILVQEILAGLTELRRPASGLFLSSLSAGLDVGFGVLLMAVVYSILGEAGDPLTLQILVASSYSVGFLLVLLGRSELFTEHTALAVLPVLAGRSSFGALVRLWGIVYAGNMIGAAAFAGLLASVGPELRLVEKSVFARIGEAMVGLPWWAMLASAVLAGWLMGELGWLLAAARDTISQIVCVWFVTSAIGFAHLHHIVVGTAELMAGVLVSDSLTMGDFARFALWTTLGNAIGGVFFVAIIKYGHASRGAKEHDAELAKTTDALKSADDETRGSGGGS